MTTAEKMRENKARKAAKRQGFEVRKSRARHTYPLNVNDFGGYRIIDQNNAIIAGEKFDMSLEQVEASLSEGVKR